MAFDLDIFYYIHLCLDNNDRNKQKGGRNLHKIDNFLNTHDTQILALKLTVNVSSELLSIYNCNWCLLYFVLSTYDSIVKNLIR